MQQISTSLAPLAPHGVPVDATLLPDVNFFFCHLEQGQLNHLLMLVLFYGEFSPAIDRLCEPFLGKRGARHFELEVETYLPSWVPDQRFECYTSNGYIELEIYTKEESVFDQKKVVDSAAFLPENTLEK